MRTHWTELPAAVRRGVTARCGGVTHVRDLPYGSASDCVAVLGTAAGPPVFIKAVRVADHRAAMHRNEARIVPLLPTGIAPALRAVVEVDGWLVLLFDHHDGRHLDLSPGTADLPLLAAALAGAAERLTGCAIPVLPMGRRWAGRVVPELVAGDTVAHTDVSPRNFLVRGTQVVLVDWATPGRGPAWIDTALVACRLVRAGHRPSQALAWAEGVAPWKAADPAVVAEVLHGVADIWRRREHAAPAPHRAELVAATLDLVDFLRPGHRRCGHSTDVRCTVG
ncbi:hypothetical protein GCM10010124_08030 [Pilimelia terevasa]|uniref:Aminoglycoside phosphotransferase n=1 Tax=Pilimelia terevasa TaxID=53372 RepID=A0A8J3BKM5_9ACTN|nr:hypothetical protein [Pilimelia terevasa]GGK17862.1 hypothetical protein GCM10010124_08030 [Pilimelia terevasa]